MNGILNAQFENEVVEEEIEFLFPDWVKRVA